MKKNKYIDNNKEMKVAIKTYFVPVSIVFLKFNLFKFKVLSYDPFE